MDDPLPPPPMPSGQAQVGPFLAIVIVVILFALGGLYFFIQKETQLRAAPPSGNTQTNS